MVLSPDSIIPFFPEAPLIRPDTSSRPFLTCVLPKLFKEDMLSFLYRICLCSDRIYLAQVKRLLQPKSEPDRFEVYFLKTKAWVDL